MDARQKEITFDIEALPRSVGGGLKRAPVEELLRQLQWGYRELFAEHLKLQEEVEQLRRQLGDGAAAQALVDSEPEPAPTVAPPADDEAARLAITASYRAARELRDSARRDCEAMLRKARRRVAEYDEEFERLKRESKAQLDAEIDQTRQSKRNEIEQLDSIVDGLRRQLRQVLQAIEADPAP